MKLLKNGWIFGLLILLVTITEFSLLKIILQFGFTSDDWWILFDYKIYGAGRNFLDKYTLILQSIGLHHTYQIIYIGILESFFHGNYQAYHITNIIIKSLATLSIYPLILVVFKRKLLAFLTTILFAISYSSTGALLFVITGSDYLAIFFMNIFFLAYYYYFKTGSKLLLLLSSILLFISFMLSPIRMFPLLGFVLMIEIFVWVKSRKLFGFVNLTGRLIVLSFPFWIIWLITHGSTGNYLKSSSVVFSFISYGNYHLLLSPFAGLGYTLLTNDYWSVIFGNLSLNSFNDYLLFLVKGPLIIYSTLTVLISFLITKKRFFYILAVILTNVIFQIICYFLITNLKGATGPNIKVFNDSSIYAIFLGFFLISIAISALLIWFKNKRTNLLLLSIFLGPIFSSIFVWGTWFIKGDVLTFKEGIHWYMVIIAMGTCLFLATLMVFAFDKRGLIANPRLRYFFMVLLFLLILPISLISRKEIQTTFSHFLSVGYKASDQEEMKYKLVGNIKEPLYKKSRFFYFETDSQKFYPIPLLDGFEERMHFQDWEIVDGCVGLIWDKNKLEESVVTREGIKGFNVSSLCVKNSFEAGRQEIFYSPENLYAFRLKDREVIDIKEETLKNLGFQRK